MHLMQSFPKAKCTTPSMCLDTSWNSYRKSWSQISERRLPTMAHRVRKKRHHILISWHNSWASSTSRKRSAEEEDMFKELLITNMDCNLESKILCMPVLMISMRRRQTSTSSVINATADGERNSGHVVTSRNFWSWVLRASRRAVRSWGSLMIKLVSIQWS